MKKSLVLCAVTISFASHLAAEIRVKPVEYADGGQTLEGDVAWDSAEPGQRPGVLVIHDWNSIDEYELRRLRELAGLGYVAFAADIYGKGVRPGNREESAAQAEKYRSDIPLFRRRLRAALEELKKQPQCDPGRVVVIGYCFGGTGALELARSGAEIRGAVSFHGGVKTPNPADAKNIRCPVLVLHGAADPHVPDEEVAAFREEMTKAGVDWQLVYFGGAVHSFTEPEAGDDPSTGAAYDAKADARSWAALGAFLREVFASPPDR